MYLFLNFDLLFVKLLEKIYTICTYTTFFLIISLYAVIDILRDLLTEKELDVFLDFYLDIKWIPLCNFKVFKEKHRSF